MNLFKRAAVCTDVHVGLKSNSVTHNEDCLAFIEWFIAEAKAKDCDVAIICGDWHNHRASISILSLHYSMQCLEKLNAAFDRVFFIAGNHDLYYREKRDINSVAWAKYLPNVTVIDEIYKEGDVTLCPWLVGDEFKQVKKFNTKYTFGHFELPNFYMNAMVLMPDIGHVSIKDFESSENVYSGHFHKRQAQGNIWYIGNAFPHNYADAGDDARGMMIQTWGEEPEFVAWPDAPKYRVYKLSEVLENPEGLLLARSYNRIHLDITISFEEANFIRETLIPQYSLREIQLIPMKPDQSELTDGNVELKFESVDQVVADTLTELQDGHFDKNLLLDIYRNL